ncbi:hypothetical protein OH492_25530 [Vibrio chagasii]|nr:hypothetical protein [Vibrio chagasii]
MVGTWSLTTKDFWAASLLALRSFIVRFRSVRSITTSLTKSGKSVTIQAAIKDEYSHTHYRPKPFLNVSGLGASIGFSGVDVRLESLSALLGGSIAVDLTWRWSASWR